MMRALIDWLERVAVAANVRRLNRWLWWLGAILGVGYLAFYLYTELTRDPLLGQR
ncbi:MAG TPA: hypothetical protein VG013_37310 [Gemmataceae bacterium]|nr:hypothetical protein [Gemmataceae bacterium]